VVAGIDSDADAGTSTNLIPIQGSESIEELFWDVSSRAVKLVWRTANLSLSRCERMSVSLTQVASR